MTTRQPSGVQIFPDDTFEKIAYRSVEMLPVREPNDRVRLGYHVWQFLLGKIPTLQEAITVARARLLITESDAYTMISRKLQESGVQKIL